MRMKIKAQEGLEKKRQVHRVPHIDDLNEAWSSGLRLKRSFKL